jgi:TDG/mug DNA glycosylase family protein
MLVCGLNPSPYAARTGIPFGRPGNRFWPAALRAGLLSVARDPRAALERGIGFTDLVKRVTPSARELSRAEYERGLRRLRALVARLDPGAICFIGLEGFRRAVDARAVAGALEGGFAGRPAYLMPSTSGRNARASVEELAAHLRSAARLACGRPRAITGAGGDR